MNRLLRFCGLTLALGLSAPVPAQLPGAAAQVASCAPARESRISDLRGRSAALSAQIDADAPRIEALEKELKGANPSPPALELQSTQQKRQAELISVLYLIDCFREDAVDDPGLLRSQASPGQNIEILVPYATNRRNVGGADPFRFYGSEDGKRLEFGSVRVTIPLSHKPGAVELPSHWKLERNADPKKHFTLKQPTPVSEQDFGRGVAEDLKAVKKKSLLLFVHGFNVAFAEAALRTAQLAHDLKFPGIVMFYSWPSAGETSAYFRDEEMARLSEKHFDSLLDLVGRLGFDAVYLMAHSMGTRVVGHALEDRIKTGKKDGKLREIMLAAGDINAAIFEQDVAPKLEALQGTRTTIYASSRDIALVASRKIHQMSRLGDVRDVDPKVYLRKGMETIDASAVASTRRAFGHSYVFDSPRVIRDIEVLLQLSLPAAKRGLADAGGNPQKYWQILK